MPSKFVTVGGIAINYLYARPTTLPGRPPRFGRGLPLLFVHAAGSNANTWRHQVGHFGAAHCPVAFDFPGHGRSGGVDGLPSIAAYAACTAAFATAVEMPPAVVIGRSMGGAVAMEYALAHPDRVRGLVLAATAARFALSAERLETWRNVMRGRIPQPFTAEAFSPKTDPAVVHEAWMEQVKTDPRVRYGDFIACNSFDVLARLGEIRCPTLVVAGRDDTITPLAASEELHAGIQGSRLAIIDDAGHTIPSEKPAEFNAAVERFLGELP